VSYGQLSNKKRDLSANDLDDRRGSPMFTGKSGRFANALVIINGLQLFWRIQTFQSSTKDIGASNED
jgi:hypothetical protein